MHFASGAPFLARSLREKWGLSNYFHPTYPSDIPVAGCPILVAFFATGWGS